MWLYVFKQGLCRYHSGIGTRGAYWIFSGGQNGGVTTYGNYTKDICNGPLTYWYELGQTDKTLAEVEAIVTGESREGWWWR